MVYFETSFKTKSPRMVNDLIFPNYNVATLNKGAVVIEGVSRMRHALLNGDTKHYDWDSGYTCHQLGSGSILIQLGQPYIIASLRLLLWDCDERSYSYYIESSVNFSDWETVIDYTRENCKSWQVIHFTPRPIVFIRIVGTHNTENEVFHCVHFECPSMENSNNSPEEMDRKHRKTMHLTGTSSGRLMDNIILQPTETATEAEELPAAVAADIIDLDDLSN